MVNIDARHVQSPYRSDVAAILRMPGPRSKSAHVSFARMEALKLRFPAHNHPELPLAAGVHGIGRVGDTVGVVDEVDAPVVRFCVDRRGVWLSVAEGARGVHVNGRPVQRLAMLRVGDAIYVDGVEMVLTSERGVAPVPDALRNVPAEPQGDTRVVLRGVGGQYHGRSFTLEHPRLIGRSGDADIRIDDPAFAERHARIELLGTQIVLRDLGSVDGSLVNGETVRDALLLPGDQIVFDAHHRFVIETPAVNLTAHEQSSPAPASVKASANQDEGAGKRSGWPLPWLLFAALILAAALSALLLFGGT